MSSPSSVQRSFRLTGSTSALLDSLAESTRESRNSLVERLLAEALRTEHHPLIRFVPGAAGVREPTVVGTRLKVRQVMEQVRAEGGDTAAAAVALGVDAAVVAAAVSYYAEFTPEVDADAAWAAEVEERERIRWEREQALLT